ncbi:hypothetical protein JYU34_011514 [Plutella xylostella]|uniref:Uncharacterized protein n=1 Tax=Plutella xylostella TaxID=51655 RepID=A0ABQ7QI11_PLUXY|nr:hypothetical protein JYU34_011514 [Plutella xylostella]
MTKSGGEGINIVCVAPGLGTRGRGTAEDFLNLVTKTNSTVPQPPACVAGVRLIGKGRSVARGPRQDLEDLDKT